MDELIERIEIAEGAPMTRFITTWRKPAPDILDWDHFISDSETELLRVIENLKKQGVWQYHTWELGSERPEQSSDGKLEQKQ